MSKAHAVAAAKPQAAAATRRRRTCACGACAECEKKQIRRRATGTTRDAHVPARVYDVLASAGQPLDAPTRTFMESRFGHDFSRVRIHADLAAAESARAVTAQAYTVGRHVVFGRARFAPQTLPGRELLAHELAHVVQQHDVSESEPPEVVGRDDDRAERHADDAARRALDGASPTAAPEPPVAVARPVVRRQEEDLGLKPDLPWIALEVYKGMKGPGTDEERVYRALERLKRHQPWINELKKAYARYGDLLEDLDDDFSGTELDYALQLINLGDPRSPRTPRARRYSWEELRTAARELVVELDRFETDEERVYALLLPLDHDPHLILGLEMAFSEATKGAKLPARLEAEMSGEELSHAKYLISIPYEWWVRRANEKLRKTEFGIPWGSFCGPEPKRDSVWPDAFDDRYWTQEPDPEFGCMLVLKRGVLPSVAVEAIVEEQDRWNIDCGIFVQLAQWYALLHVEGATRFNERMTGPVRLRVEKSTALDVEATYCRRDIGLPLLPCMPKGKDHVPVPKAKPVNEAEVLKSAPIGTRIVFTNPLVAEAQQRLRELPTDVEAYLNENTVKLGENEYGAFPLRGSSGYVVSRNEVIEQMAERTYKALDKKKDEVRAQIFISLIQITRPAEGVS